MCSICWSEPLGAAPSVRLGCSHVFHLHCVRERLRQRWAGRAINFEFAHCPLCKAGVAHKAIDALVAPHAENEKVLRSRALERLHYDGLDKAAAIVHEGGPFHNKYGRRKHRIACPPLRAPCASSAVPCAGLTSLIRAPLLAPLPAAVHCAAPCAQACRVRAQPLLVL